MSIPTYDQISQSFGFPIPHSYYDLVRFAFELRPDDPWNALEPLDFIYLDETSANPNYVYPGHDYASTPPEVHVIGWTGTDGAHYGLVVDDVPAAPQELPIAEVYPVDGECRLLGMNLSEFLSALVIRSIDAYGQQWHEDHAQMVLNLVDRFGVNEARNLDEMLLSTVHRRAESGIVLTSIDGCGAKVPMHTVDWEYWRGLDWKAVTRERSMPERLLHNAETRLRNGDYATSFLIAKNLWMLFWQYRPSGDDRDWVKRTGGVMEQAYLALGRPYLAKKMRSILDWVLEEVVRPT